MTTENTTAAPELRVKRWGTGLYTVQQKFGTKWFRVSGGLSLEAANVVVTMVEQGTDLQSALDTFR